jgi:hypothetical protein
MPLEVTDALLELLFGEEQTIVLTIDRRAVASSADRRAQIAKQHLALAYRRFGELLAATDDLGASHRRPIRAAQLRMRLLGSASDLTELRAIRAAQLWIRLLGHA